jgi:hypothetical protein
MSFFIYVHEKAHVQACVYFGGKAEMHLISWPTPHTHCEGAFNITELALADSINESIGYTAEALMLAFFFGVGLIIMSREAY